LAGPDRAKIPNGVYRKIVTEEELLAAGILPDEARREAGIYTLTLDDGGFLFTTQNDFGLPDCEGTYSGSGARVSFVNKNCGGSEFFTAIWTLANGELRFESVEAGIVIVASFGNKPWKKIG
jgi:hypothetical protein